MAVNRSHVAVVAVTKREYLGDRSSPPTHPGGVMLLERFVSLIVQFCTVSPLSMLYSKSSIRPGYLLVPAPEMVMWQPDACAGACALYEADAILSQI